MLMPPPVSSSRLTPISLGPFLLSAPPLPPQKIWFSFSQASLQQTAKVNTRSQFTATRVNLSRLHARSRSAPLAPCQLLIQVQADQTVTLDSGLQAPVAPSPGAGELHAILSLSREETVQQRGEPLPGSWQPRQHTTRPTPLPASHVPTPTLLHPIQPPQDAG